MAETIVTLFVEGDTEVDFYKKLIAYFREKNGGRLHCKVDVRNVKGVGKYQNKVCRIFENSVKKQYPGYDYKVVLCYDSDVFEYSRKPVTALFWLLMDIPIYLILLKKQKRICSSYWIRIPFVLMSCVGRRE